MTEIKKNFLKERERLYNYGHGSHHLKIAEALFQWAQDKVQGDPFLSEDQSTLVMLQKPDVMPLFHITLGKVLVALAKPRLNPEIAANRM